MTWCSQCEQETGGRFCGTCGGPLTNRPPTCPCGALADFKRDRFCYMCWCEKAVTDSHIAAVKSPMRRFLEWWAK